MSKSERRLCKEEPFQGLVFIFSFLAMGRHLGERCRSRTFLIQYKWLGGEVPKDPA